MDEKKKIKLEKKIDSSTITKMFWETELKCLQGFKGWNKPFQAGEEKFKRNQPSRIGKQICVV